MATALIGAPLNPPELAGTSDKVSASEMDAIRKVLSGTASPLCFAICHIIMALPTSQGWQNTNQTGAAVLVMDRVRNAKIIRVYDLKTMEVILDEELYVGLRYIAAKNYFHMFEATGAIIGLDFANIEDAANFHSKVVAMVPASQTAGSPLSVVSSNSPSPSAGFLGKVKGIFSKKDKEMQIGAPSNVIHKHHIGIDPEKGFEVKNIPEEWKALFKATGVKPSDLKDYATANLVFETISSHYRASVVAPVPPVASTAMPAEPVHVRRPPPPPHEAPLPPHHQKTLSSGLGQPDMTRVNPPSNAGFDGGRPLPPPPVADPSRPMRTRRAPRGPPPPQRQPPGPPSETSSRKVAAPPPPPPIPLQVSSAVDDEYYSAAKRNSEPYQNTSEYGQDSSIPAPPVPPPSTSFSEPSTPSRSDLLGQIRAGRALRPVSTPRSTTENQSNDDQAQLPDLSSMRDSDKMSMMNHIKTLLDARRDVIATEDDSDGDDWD